MKLYSLAASPFARKARILVIELGLEQRVEIVNPGTVTPVSNNDKLNTQNPLGMIPVLLLDDGQSLSDSRVICEYLDHMVGGSFFPGDESQRFKALGLQSLADGIMDLSVAVRYETAMRPEELQWQNWIDHQQEKISRSLDALESRCRSFADSPTIGEVSVACALGYLDFRFSDNDWRSTRPMLNDWFQQFMQRKSLVATIPE